MGLLSSGQIVRLYEGGMSIEMLADSLKLKREEVERLIAGEMVNKKEREIKGVSNGDRLRVMERMVEVAINETDNVGAAVKAGIYVNEEFHGRNEARAKGSGNGRGSINVGQINVMIAKAREKAEKILGSNKETLTIEA